MLETAKRIARNCWKWTRRIAITVIAVSLLSILIVVSVNSYYVYYKRDNLPDIERFIKFEPPGIGEIYDSNGKVIIQLAKEYRRIVNYTELPPILTKAILATEDQRFFNHNGVDWIAVTRSAIVNMLHSATLTLKVWNSSRKVDPELGFIQGGSTVTQQLVRLYFLSEIRSQEKGNILIVNNWKTRFVAQIIGIPKTNSALRKREEARLSIWLEERLTALYGSKQVTKEEILSRFGSFVYLGNGRYGFDSASEYFFDKRVMELSDNDAGKAAFLAGLIKFPVSSKSTDYSKQLSRKNHVLNRMVINGHLPTSMAERFKNEVIVFSPKKDKTQAPSVVSDILDEIKSHGYGVDQFFEGRFSIRATTNLEIQKIANQALENGLAAYEKRYPESKGVIQGSVVVLRNNDAAILAEVGGRQVFKSQPIAYTDFNRVKHSYRQPGSVFKPFVYLTAFMDSRNLRDLIRDMPVSVSMGSVKVGNRWIRRPPKWIANYDGKSKGYIPIRQALAESRNQATMGLTYFLANGKESGIERIVSTAHLLGIKSPLHEPNQKPYITTALGASDVNLLEIANAYRAIASGISAEPYSVSRIEGRNGEIIFFANAAERATYLPINGTALDEIREGLRGIVRLPSGTAHALDNKDFPIQVAGKTGTTNDFRDALFIGFTYGNRGITVAVRVGYDDFRELGSKETGGRTALPIFKEIMLKVYEKELIGYPPLFPQDIEDNISEYLMPKPKTPQE